MLNVSNTYDVVLKKCYDRNIQMHSILERGRLDLNYKSTWQLVYTCKLHDMETRVYIFKCKRRDISDWTYMLEEKLPSLYVITNEFFEDRRNTSECPGWMWTGLLTDLETLWTNKDSETDLIYLEDDLACDYNNPDFDMFEFTERPPESS